jgi:maleylacetate reductase
VEVQSFTYNALPSRVVFGVNALDRLTEEIERMGGRRALILCSARRRAEGEAIATRLGPLSAGLFGGALMHVPMEVVDEARAYARRIKADCIVAFGGGSTIGLGKGIALEYDCSVLAIPTTYAGSEMTPIYGITVGGLKKTGTESRVLPKSVVYDPLLSVGLPVGTSVTSGINAIAHAAEGLYAKDCNTITMLMAEEGIRAFVESLPLLYRDPKNITARSNALYGAWLCGSVLGQGGMSLHHKLCHVLGGSFGLPHSDTHAVILPHALAYNYSYALLAMQRMARVMRNQPPPAFLHALALETGAPTSLRQLGLLQGDIERVADLAMANPYWNPRPLERRAITGLLQRAFEGLPPQIDAARSTAGDSV